jgi:hypothetical protein
MMTATDGSGGAASFTSAMVVVVDRGARSKAPISLSFDERTFASGDPGVR